MTVDQSVIYSLQLTTGGMFLFAAILKLPNLQGFQATLGAYAILPKQVIREAALLLVLTEAVVGLLLIVGKAVTTASVLALVMIAIFASGVTVNLLRGRSIECGCFGTSSDVISARSLVRLGLVALPPLVLLVDRSPGIALRDVLLDRDEALARSTVSSAMALCLVIVGMWILATPQLVRLARAAGHTHIARTRSPR